MPAPYYPTKECLEFIAEELSSFRYTFRILLTNLTRSFAFFSFISSFCITSTTNVPNLVSFSVINLLNISFTWLIPFYNIRPLPLNKYWILGEAHVIMGKFHVLAIDEPTLFWKERGCEYVATMTKCRGMCCQCFESVPRTFGEYCSFSSSPTWYLSLSLTPF